MGSGRGLAQVIMDMRDEIKKLESENRALRGELGPENRALCGELGRPAEGCEGVRPCLVSPAFQHKHAAEETSPHAHLRRNASAPTLERPCKENIIMKVRRYSVSPNMRTVHRESEKLSSGQEKAEDWSRLPGETRGDLRDHSTPEESVFSREKQTNRRSIQEYVHKNRAKVKTVTFLLPVDDIYTSRPFLANHRPGRKAYNLGVIVEKDA